MASATIARPCSRTSTRRSGWHCCQPLRFQRASPTGPQLSIATSTALGTCFPDGCWLSTAREYVTFVIATTLTPTAAPQPTSTGAADCRHAVDDQDVPGQTRYRDARAITCSSLSRRALRCRCVIACACFGAGLLSARLTRSGPDREESRHRQWRGSPSATGGSRGFSVHPSLLLDSCD